MPADHFNTTLVMLTRCLELPDCFMRRAEIDSDRTGSDRNVVDEGELKKRCTLIIQEGKRYADDPWVTRLSASNIPPRDDRRMKPVRAVTPGSPVRKGYRECVRERYPDIVSCNRALMTTNSDPLICSFSSPSRRSSGSALQLGRTSWRGQQSLFQASEDRSSAEGDPRENQSR